MLFTRNHCLVSFFVSTLVSYQILSIAVFNMLLDCLVSELVFSNVQSCALMAADVLYNGQRQNAFFSGTCSHLKKKKKGCYINGYY